MRTALVLAARQAMGLTPVFRRVDTCAAEFEAYTPYYYSTYYGDEDEVTAARRRRVVILGAGPNRIGQGVEFAGAGIVNQAVHQAVNAIAFCSDVFPIPGRAAKITKSEGCHPEVN